MIKLPSSFDRINEMANNKVFITRDPFHRLVSCYHDKFVLQHGPEKCNVSHYCGKTHFGPLIVNVSRPNATREELANGCPTFDEFVRFVSTFRNYHNNRNFFATVRKQCLRSDPRAIQHW